MYRNKSATLGLDIIWVNFSNLNGFNPVKQPMSQIASTKTRDEKN